MKKKLKNLCNLKKCFFKIILKSYFWESTACKLRLASWKTLYIWLVHDTEHKLTTCFMNMEKIVNKISPEASRRESSTYSEMSHAAIKVPRANPKPVTQANCSEASRDHASSRQTISTNWKRAWKVFRYALPVGFSSVVIFNTRGKQNLSTENNIFNLFKFFIEHFKSCL